jgi:hypothetical protein
LLPEIRKSDARASELFNDPHELTKELLSPVGEGKICNSKTPNIISVINPKIARPSTSQVCGGAQNIQGGAKRIQ